MKRAKVNSVTFCFLAITISLAIWGIQMIHDVVAGIIAAVLVVLVMECYFDLKD